MITILTEPIPSATERYAEGAKERIRPLLRKIDRKRPLDKPAYGGHFAVTRSLVEGFRTADVPFVYNPRTMRDCTRDVVVLAGLNTTEQAIRLRADGVIKRLAVGPNIVVSPLDAPEIIGSEYIDRYIVNSEWVAQMYSTEMPSLKPKLVIWPAGVDEKFWKPDGRKKDSRRVLFYSKRADEKIFDQCVAIAKQEGWSVSVLEYGSYTLDQYKEMLDEHALLVHLTPSESQGISLAEAWAMNVPALVWNPGRFVSYGREFACSSAPMLSDQTGLFFTDANEFRAALRAASEPARFSPRKWILGHVTDEIAARHLLQLLTF